MLASSTIIQEIVTMRRAGLASLAFFYCDYREDQKKGPRGFLSSLLVQLCHQTDSYCEMVSKFYTEHANGSRNPGDHALMECLKNLLKLPGHAPVYVIMDALDECSNTSPSAIRSPRKKVLMLLVDLIDSKLPNLRICVTSRPERDIMLVLDPFVCHSVSLHEESGQKMDIDDYIKSVINTHPKNRRWKADIKRLVSDVLTDKADGM
jgi:NACHT domain